MQVKTRFPVTLGVDFGTKRVGLAISRSQLVEPLVTLVVDDDFWSNLAKIIHTQAVEQVVIGLSERDSAHRAQNWGQELSRRFQLKIFFADETLSTHEAKLRLQQAGHRLIPGEPIDHFAAAIILENWLENI